MKIKKIVSDFILKTFSINPAQTFVNFSGFGAHLRRKSVETDPAGSYAGWVYAALSKRAKRIGSIDLSLYDLKRGSGELEEIDDHELLSLLQRPNPMQSQYQFFYTIEMMLGIWGSSPIYKDRSGSKRIMNLWPLRPDLLKSITNADGKIVKYTYTVGGEVKDLAPEDVFLINEPSPTSIITGFSPTQAASLEIDSDIAAAVWNKCLIENFAEPGGVLTTDQKLDDKEFERLKKTWDSRHSGPTNAGRWAVLEKGLKAEAIGRSPKDMDLNETRKFNRNAISAILGVPMSLMTSEDVNLANAEVGERVFAKDTVEPQMKLIVTTFDEFLVPEFGDTLWLSFQSPVPEDVQQKINIALAGEGRWMTVNEAREIFNLPALDGGDAIFKPIGVMAQVGEGADANIDPNIPPAKQTPTGYEKIVVERTERPSKKHSDIIRSIKARTFFKRKLLNDIQEKSYSKIMKSIHDHSKCKSSKIVLKLPGARLVAKDDGDSKAMDARLIAERKGFIKALPRQQKKFQKRLNSFFGDQLKEVLANLSEEGLPKGRGGRIAVKSNVGKWVNRILFDKKNQDDLMVEISSDMYRDNIRVGSEAVGSLLGISPSDVLATPFVVDFITDRSFLLLAVNETTRTALSETMRLGVAQGEDLGQIRERISEVYAQAQGFRAEQIARTEVGAAQNFGRLAEMENQKVQKKVWIATFSNTRDAHADADGQVVGVDESFSVGGESLEYPGDPSGSAENTINCQCSVSPTL